MQIGSDMADEAVLRLVGERLAALRLARNLTQQDLAEQAGVGLRTVQRLELGAAATQLSGLIRVCRVLGLVENLDLLIPPPTVSPMAQLKLAGRKRRRASGGITSPGPAKKWMWGDAP